MKYEVIDASLEANMLQYDDIKDIPVVDNGEALVAIVKTPFLLATQLRAEMLPFTGTEVFVRSGVRARLNWAATQLGRLHQRFAT